MEVVSFGETVKKLSVTFRKIICSRNLKLSVTFTKKDLFYLHETKNIQSFLLNKISILPNEIYKSY